MEVKEIPIANIKVQNRAREDMGDIEELAQSIQERGLIQPITVNSNMRLLAGERRLAAHKHLGLTTISAVVRSTTDLVDAFEIELAENIHRKNMAWHEICRLHKRIFEEKSKKGKWNQTKQAEMMHITQPHVSRQIQMAEALELLPELAAKTDFAEAWRELQSLGEGLEEEVAKKPAVKQQQPELRSSNWAENSYQVGDVLTTMPATESEAFDFVEIDPPFTDADEYGALYDFIAHQTYRVLRPNSFAVFWYRWEWHSEVRFILQTAGFDVDPAPAIWIKEGGRAATSDSQSPQHEPFWIARKGSPNANCSNGGIFKHNPIKSDANERSTERPITLLDEILRIYCRPQSRVLVPFAGSGVTIRAAHKLGHAVTGFDISEVCREKFLKTVERSEDA